MTVRPVTAILNTEAGLTTISASVAAMLKENFLYGNTVGPTLTSQHIRVDDEQASTGNREDPPSGE